MIINLYDTLSTVSRQDLFTAQIRNLRVEFQGENIVLDSDPFELKICCTDKHVLQIACAVTVKALRTCSRCLGDVDCTYDLCIRRTVDVEKRKAYLQDASEADEISYIEDCALDVDGLVLDELYTVIPMSVLCKADCKGICKVCGINLNQGSCNCDQSVPDPRMAVFGDIFNQFKEV